MVCREYTLPREGEASQPKGWIQGDTKIVPVLEVTTSCLHGKHGVEIRILSLNGDNTHSWVRISHGSNKFLMDSNNNDTEVPEDLPEEQASHLNAEQFVSQPKAKAKPQRTCWLFTEYHSDEQKDFGLILNQGITLSLCVRSFEECNSSSSSFSASTSRGGRRRSKNKIPVLH